MLAPKSAFSVASVSSSAPSGMTYISISDDENITPNDPTTSTVSLITRSMTLPSCSKEGVTSTTSSPSPRFDSSESAKSATTRNNGAFHFFSSLFNTNFGISISGAHSMRGSSESVPEALPLSTFLTRSSMASRTILQRKSVIIISTDLRKRVSLLHSARRAARSMNVIL